MSFEKIKNFLDLQYIFVEGKEKNYYCDQDNRIVATINDEVITLYLDDPEDELETQYQKIALSILNCPIGQAGQTEMKKLIGAYNDTKIEEGISTLCYNNELDTISGKLNKDKDAQRNLGCVGKIELENGNISFLLNEIENIQPKNQGIKMIKRNPIMIKRPKGLRKKYC